MLLCNILFHVIIHVPRDNIERDHSDEVAVLKNQYSDEDKKTIKKFLQAKKQAEMLNSRMIQEETDQDSSSGKVIW